eukprot:1230586-Rhodomonas_salina.1
MGSSHAVRAECSGLDMLRAYCAMPSADVKQHHQDSMRDVKQHGSMRACCLMLRADGLHPHVRTTSEPACSVLSASNNPTSG